MKQTLTQELYGNDKTFWIDYFCKKTRRTTWTEKHFTQKADKHEIIITTFQQRKAKRKGKRFYLRQHDKTNKYRCRKQRTTF